jgi:hypothetical protein
MKPKPDVYQRRAELEAIQKHRKLTDDEWLDLQYCEGVIAGIEAEKDYSLYADLNLEQTEQM